MGKIEQKLKKTAGDILGTIFNSKTSSESSFFS
jgi:hypothetical protein